MSASRATATNSRGGGGDDPGDSASASGGSARDVTGDDDSVEAAGSDCAFLVAWHPTPRTSTISRASTRIEPIAAVYCKHGAGTETRIRSTFGSRRRVATGGIPTTVRQGCPAPVERMDDLRALGRVGAGT